MNDFVQSCPHCIPSMVRIVFVALHLVSICIAIGGVFLADLQLITNSKFNKSLFVTVLDMLPVVMVAIWSTGFGIIFIDSGMQWDWEFLYTEITTSSKMMAKMTVTTFLLLNGIFLHFVVFKNIFKFEKPKLKEVSTFMVYVSCISGTISSVSWLFALFLGVAKMPELTYSYHDFIGLYLAALAGSITFSVFFVKPYLQLRLKEINKLEVI